MTGLQLQAGGNWDIIFILKNGRKYDVSILFGTVI
jgi:hypothetical protein